MAVPSLIMNRNIPIGQCNGSSSGGTGNGSGSSSLSSDHPWLAHHQRLRLNSVGLFPTKLHDMLDYAEQQGLTDIISWTNDGLAFNIHSQERLGLLLPQFFGQTKVRSFQRQLHLWSFEKLREGVNRGAMAHPFFMKGRKEIIQNVSRQSFKRSATRGRDFNHHDKTIDTNKIHADSKFSATKSPLASSQIITTNHNNIGNSSCSSSFDDNEFIPNMKKKTPSASSLSKSNMMLGPVSITTLNKLNDGPIMSMYSGSRRIKDTADANGKEMKSIPSSSIVPTSTQSNWVCNTPCNAIDTQHQQSYSMFHEGDLVDFEGKQFFFLDLDILF